MKTIAKKLFKDWNLWEIAWLSTFSALSLVLSALFDETPIGFLAFLTGATENSLIITAKGCDCESNKERS